MSQWDRRFVQTGLAVPDGNKVKVFYGSGSAEYVAFDCGAKVLGANWAGGYLNVVLSDGKARRYYGNGSAMYTVM